MSSSRCTGRSRRCPCTRARSGAAERRCASGGRRLALERGMCGAWAGHCSSHSACPPSLPDCAAPNPVISTAIGGRQGQRASCSRPHPPPQSALPTSLTKLAWRSTLPLLLAFSSLAAHYSLLHSHSACSHLQRENDRRQRSQTQVAGGTRLGSEQAPQSSTKRAVSKHWQQQQQQQWWWPKWLGVHSVAA
ncbi:hypothetical protein GQ54DRAFT_104270 [Martensiomyces pterosporus]|nr:hypothetical protein GQ54DRAFT_104270 [Martensiomyces pterosporus]